MHCEADGKCNAHCSSSEQRQKRPTWGSGDRIAEESASCGKAAPSDSLDRASGTMLPSVGKCPAEINQPRRARRQESSRATASKGPLPFCFRRLVSEAVLSPTMAQGSFWK